MTITAKNPALWPPKSIDIQNRTGILTVDGEAYKNRTIRIQIEDITPDPAKSVAIGKDEAKKLIAELINWVNHVEIEEAHERRYERMSDRRECVEW